MVCVGVVGAASYGYNHYYNSDAEIVVVEATNLLNDLDSTFPDVIKTTTEEGVNQVLLMDQLHLFVSEVPIERITELQQMLQPGHLAFFSVFFATYFC